MSGDVFEQSVRNLLTAGGFRFMVLRRRARPFDFLIEEGSRQHTAIRVLGDKVRREDLEIAADHLRFATSGVDRFFLVTPEKPGMLQRRTWNSVFAGVPVDHTWLGGGELAPALGLGDGIDLTSAKHTDSLQMAAITENIQRYTGTTTAPRREASELSRIITGTGQRMREIPQEYNMLRRQFSFGTIHRLTAKKKPLKEQLLIGQRLDNVTVVMSDLKNFSTLVTRAGEGPVRHAMSRYYPRARELVWDHRGVLDKFIGDAVMAIFNYPWTSSYAPMRAMAFARDLIDLGSEIIGEMELPADLDLETGTRVGICTGDISVMDIGQDELEVSFFGDTINLAARLEHNAAVDGLLIDDRTFDLVRDEDPGLLELLDPGERVLAATEVKGQDRAVRGWSIDYAAMADVEIATTG